MASLLELTGLDAGYGEATVLEQVSLAIDPGDSVALLGRNGTGKTTLLATIMGATTVHRGRIALGGIDLLRQASHRRAASGIGWVAQERDIFPSLTVEENLQVAARPGPWTLARIYRTFDRLHARRATFGSPLSGGEQQLLAMARALMLNARLLLLDEPLEGLAPKLAAEMLEIVRMMLSSGDAAVILVEQHARRILPLTRRAIVLERGRIVADRSSRSLMDAPDELDAWLGVAATAAASAPPAR